MGAYLERNSQILAEIPAHLKVAKDYPVYAKFGSGSRHSAYSLGSFYSTTVGEDLYAIWKDHHHFQARTTIERDFITELGIVDLIADEIPELKPELPVFFGLIKNPSGDVTGTIMEDFTKCRSQEPFTSGRRISIESCEDFSQGEPCDEQLFTKLTGLIFGMTLSRYWADIFFLVGPRRGPFTRRMGDFDRLYAHLSSQMRRQMFNQDEIESRLAQFTVTLDRAA